MRSALALALLALPAAADPFVAGYPPEWTWMTTDDPLCPYAVEVRNRCGGSDAMVIKDTPHGEFRLQWIVDGECYDAERTPGAPPDILAWVSGPDGFAAIPPMLETYETQPPRTMRLCRLMG